MILSIPGITSGPTTWRRYHAPRAHSSRRGRRPGCEGGGGEGGGGEGPQMTSPCYARLFQGPHPGSPGFFSASSQPFLKGERRKKTPSVSG